MLMSCSASRSAEVCQPVGTRQRGQPQTRIGIGCFFEGGERTVQDTADDRARIRTRWTMARTVIRLQRGDLDRIVADALRGDRCGLRHVAPRAHADTLTSTTVNPRRSSMLSMTVLDLSSAINDFANFLQICCEVPGVGADTSQRVASKITGKTDWLPAKLQSTARLTRPLHRRARRRSPRLPSAASSGRLLLTSPGEAVDRARRRHRQKVNEF